MIEVHVDHIVQVSPRSIGRELSNAHHGDQADAFGQFCRDISKWNPIERDSCIMEIAKEMQSLDKGHVISFFTDLLIELKEEDDSV